MSNNNKLLDNNLLLSNKALHMLTTDGFYKLPEETNYLQTLHRPADVFSVYKGQKDEALAQRLKAAIEKGWFMYSSPVLSNAGVPNALPISCFLAMIPDSKEGLIQTRAETAWLSMMGGGIAIYAGNRSVDDKSTGVMAHLKGYDADTLSYKQTATRRGSMAAYLDITHPEIIPFLEMRDPTAGDSNKKCFNLNNGVNITDAFMCSVINNEDYELIDPKYGKTGKLLNAREVWEKILNMRFSTGEPYLHFVDTTNRSLPKQITNPNYKVRQSNLCSEITLMTDEERTAVCCLSSLNLDKYDEWKDTSLVADLVTFLDNVLEYFIENADQDKLKRAIYSAKQERAIGLGTIGLHSYLQSKSIPFESREAAQACYYIYKDIKEKAEKQSRRLGAHRGEAPDCATTGFRNSHLLAIAPNASSADLLGRMISTTCGSAYNTSPSPSIEPLAGNAYNSQGRTGSHLICNEHLLKLLESKGVNVMEQVDKVIADNGSVQQLDCLTEHEKKVFKCGNEINPMWIIELASIRQEFICQSQSVNIFVRKGITLQEMSDIHMYAWKKGLKALYYCRGEAARKIGTGSEQPLNSVPVVIEYGTCLSCEG